MVEEYKERVFVTNSKDLETYLEQMYSFDPWLCPKGYPIMLGEDVGYWVLISPQAAADIEAGNADTIGRLRCFVQMPAEPVAEVPAGYGTVFIPHQEGVDATAPWAAKGYVLLHKDHVTAKGTILTLTRKPEEAKA